MKRFFIAASKVRSIEIEKLNMGTINGSSTVFICLLLMVLPIFSEFRLNSPNYPGIHPHANIMWPVEGHPGIVVTFNPFMRLDTKSTLCRDGVSGGQVTNNCYDYIQVLDNRYCGKIAPESITIPAAQNPKFRFFAKKEDCEFEGFELTGIYTGQWQGYIYENAPIQSAVKIQGMGANLRLLVTNHPSALTSPSDVFKVDGQGFIRLVSPLATTSYEIKYNVTSGTTFNAVDVIIYVVIVKEPPVFNRDSPYIVFVQETSSIGFNVLATLTATDPHPGLKPPNITFNIHSGDGSIIDGSSKFSIDSESGYITVSSQLDFEVLHVNQQTAYIVIVEASFLGGPLATSSATVSIYITDQDDVNPVFIIPSCYKDNTDCINSNFTMSTPNGIPDDSPLSISSRGLTVVLTAKDGDATIFDQVILSVDKTEPPGYESYLRIENMNGSEANTYSCNIYQDRAFDRNIIQSLHVVVKAQEVNNNKRESSTSILLTITQANLNPPAISGSNGTFEGYILESADVGSFIQVESLDQSFNLSISDPDVLDMDPPQTYTFTTYPSDLFEVDGSGLITLKGQLDFEVNHNYSIKVMVTEASTPEQRNSTVDIIIFILDVNDNTPEFQGVPYNTSVRELTPVGSIVFTSLTATDRDSTLNQIIRYAIVADTLESDGRHKFSINSESGNIMVSADIDFEVLHAAGRTFYTLFVSATDQALLISERRANTERVTITILNDDDLDPVFILPGCHQVAGVCFNPEYTIFIPNGSTKTAPLVISPGNIAMDASNSPVIQIIARDGDALLNDEIDFTVMETVPGGYESYFNINATASTNNTYQAMIYLNTTNIFDRRNIQSLRVVIMAQERNGFNRYSRAVITVYITQSNNNNPIIISSTGSFTGYIYEGVFEQQFVRNSTLETPLRLIVTDEDVLQIDPPQNYTFKTSPDDVFMVDDDGYVKIVPNTTLDYESTTHQTFTVTVTETTPEQRNSTMEITVNLLDINDNNPVFETRSYNLTIPEGAYTLNPYNITTFNVTDIDSGDNGYINFTLDQIIPDQSIESTFSVSGEGVLTAVGTMMLDEVYTLTITTTDNGKIPRSDVAMIYLQVVSAFNKSPVIPADEYLIDVCEGVLIGSSLFTIPTSDYENDPLTYVIHGEEYKSLFKVTETGVLMNTAGLDREYTSVFYLDIEVYDSSNATDVTRVIVRVTDINDHTPVFDGPYIFSVGNNAGITHVGVVSATDVDLTEPDSSNIVYSLFQPNADFVINAATGVLLSRVNFNWEVKGQHQFVVLAADKATDSRIGSTLVTVNIVDVADSVPIFSPVHYDVIVHEASDNYVIIQVTALDSDAVKDVIYEMISGEDGGGFSVDKASGEIKLTSVLNYENKHLYILKITTTDGKHQPITSATATVTVRVQKRDGCDNFDKPPEFMYVDCPAVDGGRCISPHYESSVDTDTAPVTLKVYPFSNTNFKYSFLMARDVDKNGSAVVFSLDQTVPSGYVGYFEIESRELMEESKLIHTATIRLVKRLNYSKTKTIKIIVKAKKSSGRQLEARSTINLDVKPFIIYGTAAASARIPSSYILIISFVFLQYT